MYRDIYFFYVRAVFVCAALLMVHTSMAFTIKTDIKCHIHISKHATETELYAANELANYLNQITEADCIVSTKNKKNSIIVSSIHTLPVRKKFSNTPFAEEAYSIFQDKNKLYILGSSPKTTLYAVYAFLEYLGCKWVAPAYDFYEGSNVYIPKKEALNWDFPPIYEEASFNYRKFYVEEGRSHTLEYLMQLIDWMPKVKMNTLVFPIDYEGRNEVKWDNWRVDLTPELQKREITIEVGGHGYNNFLNASMDDGNVYKNHLEWFGMDEDGIRSKDSKYVFCTSNPEALNYLYNQVLDYLNQHPEIEIFDFWTPDKERWCKCKACLHIGDAAERHAQLVNAVAMRLEQDLPQIKLECIAYNQLTNPPQNTYINKKVLIDFCPIHQNFEYQIYQNNNAYNDMYWQSLQAWKEAFQGDISIYSYFRKYAWRSLPNNIPTYMQRDIQAYREIGIKGISIYSEPGDWFTYGITHYVFAHLAWNPQVDVSGLIKDYISTVYSGSENPVQFIYSELEEIVPYACNIRHSELKTAEVYAAYKKRLQHAQALLAEHKQTAGDTSHLERLELMLEYASKSIAYMQAKASEDKEQETKIDREIRLFLRQYADKGIFIPHRQV